MGNSQGTNRRVPEREVAPQPESNDESSDEEDSGVTKGESQPFIQLKIFHELPGGTTRDLNLTINPRRKVKAFKQELSQLLNIPQRNIQIYRHKNPQSQMPDDSSLEKLGVTSGMQLRVRDSACTYTTPL